MTIEELKVRLCEEIKFNNDGYNNMCKVLDEFLEAQKTAHNSEYMAALEAIITEGVENNYAVQEIVLAVQRLNQRR